MIQLVQFSANTVYLDLTSNSDYMILSGISPYYLFEFISEATNETIRFVTPNIAPLSARTRYDEFIITVSGATSINLTGGTIDLKVGNFWRYNIYEQYPNQYNLNPALALNLLNTGRVFYTPQYNNGYISFVNTGATPNIYFTTYQS